MSHDLDQCERDVETARAKLASGLAELRSPATISDFTETVKREAVQVKDSLVQSTKENAQDAISGVIEDLKSKAAANPAAVLAIAGGLGWWLFRNPPVTTALVGAGLVSLLRTPSSNVPIEDRDLWSEGATRLKEQVVDMASSARDAATTAGERIGDRIAESAADALASVQDSVQNGISATTDQLSESLEEGKEALQRTLDRTTQTAIDGGHHVANAAQGFRDTARRAEHDLADNVTDHLPTKNSLLLAIAGVAVAGALGIASQKHR